MCIDGCLDRVYMTRQELGPHAIAIATQCKETTVHHIHKQRLCLHAKTITSDTKQSMCFLDQIRICVCVTLLQAALISCPLLCHAMHVFVLASLSLCRLVSTL